MIKRRTFQAGVLCAAAGAGAGHADTPAPTGTWSAVLEAGTRRLRLKLELGGDGTASLFSLDQGRQPHQGQLTSSSVEHIEIEFPTIKGVFSGRIASPDRIEGQWRQNGATFPLAFERGEAALAPPPPARPLTKARLAELRTLAGSPGMAAAAAHRGSGAQVWFDGERAVGTGVAIQETDLWHLGSITKSMTSTLVARLVDSGALDWGDTVGDLLGTVAPDMRDAYRSVTLRHLLCHRAGLPRDLPVTETLQFSREIADVREERRAYARKSLAMAPLGPMATTYAYSNNGYVVAGAMLEAKLGQSWEDLIGMHLFGPLGLTTAGVGAPGRPGADDQPAGHSWSEGSQARIAYRVGGAMSDNPAVIGPAGRVHMSLQDLLRYLGMHRDGTDFLRPESWKTLHTPPFGGDYAMGWVVRGNGVLWHNGSNTLWYAEVQVDPAGGTVAAAAANDGHRIKSTPAVAHALQEAAAAVS